jgi:FkbM family methyltransferase
MSIKSYLELCDKYINHDSIKTIYDIGAGKCIETIEMSEYFKKAKIFSFEANPQCILESSKNIQNKNNITLIPICIFDYDGIIKFHPIDTLKTKTPLLDGNPTASSIYIANGKYPFETYIQNEITVPCLKLYTIINIFDILEPDLLWIDLQGSEMSMFRGLNIYIKNVKFIHIEVTYKEMYKNQDMFPEINEYLVKNNFKLINESNNCGWQADLDYIRIV